MHYPRLHRSNRQELRTRRSLSLSWPTAAIGVLLVSLALAVPAAAVVETNAIRFADAGSPEWFDLQTGQICSPDLTSSRACAEVSGAAGPSGLCSGAATRACVDDTHCPAGERPCVVTDPFVGKQCTDDATCGPVGSCRQILPDSQERTCTAVDLTNPFLDPPPYVGMPCSNDALCGSVANPGTCENTGDGKADSCDGQPYDLAFDFSSTLGHAVVHHTLDCRDNQVLLRDAGIAFMDEAQFSCTGFASATGRSCVGGSTGRKACTVDSDCGEGTCADDLVTNGDAVAYPPYQVGVLLLNDAFEGDDVVLLDTCGDLGFDAAAAASAAALGLPEPDLYGWERGERESFRVGNPICNVGDGPFFDCLDQGAPSGHVMFDYEGHPFTFDADDDDGDALPRQWELCGVKPASPVTFIDLPAMGADPGRKDLFIEVDYLYRPAGLVFARGGHSHKPSNAMLRPVIEAFANAPVSNPDGSTGIIAHIDAGSDSIMNPVFTLGPDPRGAFQVCDQFGCTPATWKTLSGGATWDGSGVGSESTGILEIGDNISIDNGKTTTKDPPTDNDAWVEFDELRQQRDEARGVFHYALMAHTSPGLLGLSRGNPGSDFFSTLGSKDDQVGTQNEQTGTFFHELGHNIGLCHGGCDTGQVNHLFKPNQFSTMNYGFVVNGMTISDSPSSTAYTEGGFFDFSRTATPGLDENMLNESSVPNDPAYENFSTRYFCPNPNRQPDKMRWARYSGSIDWNCNDQTDGGTVMSNISGDCDKVNEEDMTTVTEQNYQCTNVAPLFGTVDSDRFEVLTTQNEWETLNFGGNGVIGADTSVAIQYPPFEPVEEPPLEYIERIPVEVAVLVTAPGPASLPPGAAVDVAFEVKNTGDENHTFAIAGSESAGWADLSSLPLSVTLAPAESLTVSVPLVVDAAATDGEESILVVTATSETAGAIVDDGTVVLRADAVGCGATPRAGCVLAGKAVLSINEKKAGKEKLKALLKNITTATTQSDFGDPVDGTTRYSACVYDQDDVLVGAMEIDRAGDSCRDKPCWKAVSTKGYQYKDKDTTSHGVQRLLGKGGDPGKGTVQVKAKNNAKKGQTGLGTGTAAALAGHMQATVQILTDDATCFEATMTNVRKADGVSFVAKLP